MKINAVEAELLHVKGRTVRCDEANSYCPKFCERA